MLLLDGDYGKENNFTNLPSGIQSLSRLRVLSLRHCQIQSLPPEIRQLTKLEKLELQRNNFSPAERARIRQLLPNCYIEF